MGGEEEEERMRGETNATRLENRLQGGGKRGRGKKRRKMREKEEENVASSTHFFLFNFPTLSLWDSVV